MMPRQPVVSQIVWLTTKVPNPTEDFWTMRGMPHVSYDLFINSEEVVCYLEADGCVRFRSMAYVYHPNLTAIH